VTASARPVSRGRRRFPPRTSRALGALALISLLACLAAAAPARGQALDPSSAAALAETLKILTDPAGRGAATAGSPTAKDIDRQVQSLGASPEISQEIYGLAGEVFADLVKSTGGDTGKLLEILQRAQTDPNGFANALSPATLEHLRELSTKISDVKR
jgi:hypothetical protein